MPNRWFHFKTTTITSLFWVVFQQKWWDSKNKKTIQHFVITHNQKSPTPQKEIHVKYCCPASLCPLSALQWVPCSKGNNGKGNIYKLTQQNSTGTIICTKDTNLKKKCFLYVLCFLNSRKLLVSCINRSTDVSEILPWASCSTWSKLQWGLLRDFPLQGKPPTTVSGTWKIYLCTLISLSA